MSNYYRCTRCGYRNIAEYSVLSLIEVRCDVLCPLCKDDAEPCIDCNGTGLAACNFEVSPVSLRKLTVYYSGDVITPDGSDTGIYGDGCEPGSGATLTYGWIDPDWSRTQIHENYTDVRPDRWCVDDDETPAEWLGKQLKDRLGGVEKEWSYRSRDASVTLYAYQADEPNPYDCVSVSMAAHVEGFTREEVEEGVKRANGEW